MTVRHNLIILYVLILLQTTTTVGLLHNSIQTNPRNSKSSESLNLFTIQNFIMKSNFKIEASPHLEITELKSTNQKLRALVDDLGMEVAYYKAEAKRLKSENIILLEKNKVINPSSSSILQNPLLLKSILNNPFQSISDALQIQNKVVVITSAQAPYFIEYSNKRWNELCGWESDEVQGHTCAILQGIQSDMSICATLMKNIMSTGYAQMRNINYKKNDEPFIATTTVYPIFDVSSCATTSTSGDESQFNDDQPSRLPVITHFASVMTEYRDIKLDQSEMARMKTADMSRIQKIADTKLKGKDEKFDRRIQARQFPALLCISAEYFYSHGEKLRLSNLLRLMVSSKDALVLTDKVGRIVHANKAWSDLTGYHLRDVEGKTCKFLQGDLTDSEEVESTNRSLRQNQRVEMTVLNYRRDGSAFKNHVIMLPIKGGLTEAAGVTHYCALLLPDREIPLSVDMERDEDDDGASSLSTQSYMEDDSNTGSDDEGLDPMREHTATQQQQCHHQYHYNHSETDENGNGNGNTSNQGNIAQHTQSLPSSRSGKRADREEEMEAGGEVPEIVVNGSDSANSSGGSSNKRQCSEIPGRKYI